MSSSDGYDVRLTKAAVKQLRVMIDLIDEERIVLVHAIVNRRDLERWLRSR